MLDRHSKHRRESTLASGIQNGRSRVLARTGFILLCLLVAPPARAQSDQAGRPVLFVHGWCGGSDGWAPLRSAVMGALTQNHSSFYMDGNNYDLYYDGNRVWWHTGGSGLTTDAIPKEARFFSIKFFNSSLNSFDPVDVGNVALRRKAVELAEVVKAITQITRVRDVIVIAHSMGGLVARAYAEGLATSTAGAVPYADNMATLITIDTPHAGAKLSPVIQVLNLSLGPCYVQDTVSIAAMDPDGPVIQDLQVAAGRWPANLRTHSIISFYRFPQLTPWPHPADTDGILKKETQSFTQSLSAFFMRNGAPPEAIPRVPNSDVDNPFDLHPLNCVDDVVLHKITCVGDQQQTQDQVLAALGGVLFGDPTRIEVKATLNGTPWMGDVSFEFQGPEPIPPRTNVPVNDIVGVPVGDYTVMNVSGGPRGASFRGIAPASTQRIESGNWTITFTLEFVGGPSVTTDPPVSVSATGAVLTGSVNPNGSPTDAWLEYSLSSDFAAPVTFGSQNVGSGTSPLALSFAPANLFTNTTYFYRVVARSSGGTTRGQIFTFTTSSSGNLPPPVPMLPANGSSGASLTPTLFWEPVFLATSYRVMVAASAGLLPTDPNATTCAGCVVSDIASVPNYAIQAGVLQPGTTYFWQVKARNVSQLGDWSVPWSFTTAGGSNAPAVLTRPATSVSSSGAVLQGEVNPNGLTATVWFEYSVASSLANSTRTPQRQISAASSLQPVSEQVSGLLPNTTYYYRTVASTTDGTGYGNTERFTTTAATNDFELFVSPNTNTIAAGTVATYPIVTSTTSGLPQTVQLAVSGLPLGATAVFDPPSMASGFASTLTITTSTTTPDGTYTLLVTATGSVTRSVSITLVVQNGNDFGFSITQSSQSVVAGNTVTFGITTFTLAGMQQSLQFSVSGLPSGANAVFNPPVVVSSDALNMVVTTSTSTPAGTYTLTVTAIGGRIHTASTTLDVVSPISYPIERVSVATGGVQVDRGGGKPAVSLDGRFVAFVSSAIGFYPGATGRSNQVLLRDRQTGQTTLVSIGFDGTEGNDFSEWPSISADGRYVAFRSSATNLVSGDSNFQPDIFLRDMQSGQTIRISQGFDGSEANGSSALPSISADGRFIVFTSEATNLVSRDTNGVADLFVYDQQTGETRLVSLASDGTQINGPIGVPTISGDGRYVVFSSTADNLVPGDMNGVSDVFVHDLQTGQTFRASVDSNGNEGNGHSAQNSISAISADGRFVAFASEATNLDGSDANGFLQDIYVHDLVTGTTTRVTVDSNGVQANAGSGWPSISADGNVVAFLSGPSNLDTLPSNSSTEVYVRDRLNSRTLRASLAYDGSIANSGPADLPALSIDGRFVTFTSPADNLVPNDTNAFGDVFIVGTGLDSAPVILTSWLPAGSVQLPYSHALKVVGGSAPFQWRIINGGLPAGLALDMATGELRGIPAEGGRFSFTVQVTDSSSKPRSAQRTLSLVVVVAPSAAVEVQPVSLSFSTLTVGNQAVQPITITNSGAAPLNLTTVGITGAASIDFQVASNQCSGSQVAPGGTCSLSVRFAPTVPGPANAEAVLSSNAPGAPHMVPLAGTAIDIPRISLSANSLLFGSQPNTVPSPPQLLVITNPGQTPLVTARLEIASGNASEFEILAESCVDHDLQVGEVCVVAVRFVPRLVPAGNYASELRVHTNAPGSPHVVPLTAVAVTAPTAQLSNSAMAFAGQLVGTNSSQQTIMVSNSGTASLTVTGTAISGPNASDFAQTNTCGSGVAVGQNCMISVSFRPTEAGTRIATLSVSSNAPGSPHQVVLSGVATDFSLAPAPGSTTSLTIDAGQTANYSLVLNPANGFSGTVSLSCTVPPNMTGAACSVSPSMSDVTAAVTVTVAVATVRGSVAPPWIHQPRVRFDPPVPWILALMALSLLSLAIARLRPRLALASASLCLVLALSFVMAACGGGGSDSQPPAPRPQAGTPPGTYMIGVTGTSGGAARTIQLTTIVR